jgi:hypothetical protein
MDSALRERNAGMTIIAILAIVQSAGGILRALRWFDTGSDLMGQGLLLLPLTGVFAYARGAMVALLALLFFVFAFGAFLRRSWARPLGIALAVVNLLLVASLVLQGETMTRAAPWAVIPAVMLIYFLSAAGRRTLRNA